MFLQICCVLLNIALAKINGKPVMETHNINININETINGLTLPDLIKAISNIKPTVLELNETCDTVILFDTTNDTLTGGRPAQVFEPVYQSYDNEMADDFAVDVCGWAITSVINIGFIQPSSVTAPVWNIIIYDESGTDGLPGNVIEERLGLSNYNIVSNPSLNNGADVMIVVEPPIIIDTGGYWLSVQADMDFVPNGQWFWATSLDPRDKRYAWRENGGFGTGCLDWDFGDNCFGEGEAPGALFALTGCRYTCNPTIHPTTYPSAPVKQETYNEPRMVLPIECPCGSVDMWFGPLSHIPNGYQLCDGSNGTPDLQGRFPLGIAASVEPESPGDQGGNENCEVTIKEENLPIHTHGITAVHTNTGEGSHPHTISGTAASAGSHPHTFSLTADLDGNHNHGLTAGSTDSEPNHAHGAGTLSATEDGSTHQHDVDSYFDNDQTMNELIGMPWDQVVDGNDQHIFKTLTTGDNGAHTHTISGSTEDDGEHDHGLVGNTDDEGDHSHSVSGNINDNGAHTHSVDGDTNADEGEHTHTVTGPTDPTGGDVPLNIKPPYTAVYFICCVGNIE